MRRKNVRRVQTEQHQRESEPSESHHGLLGLYGLDLQTLVLFGGSVVVLPLVRVPAQLPRRAALAVAPGLPGLRWGAGVVPALLLGDVRLGPVHRLHVLAQGAGIGVAFGAAGDFADVRFLEEIRAELG